MKIHFALSIGLLILATTTQGFLLKSAIKKKLPLLVPALSGLASSIKQQPQISAPSSLVVSSDIDSSSSSGTSSLSEQLNESFESPLSAPIPPTVTLYEYPPQQQVIYRTIRPVVRRTVYVQAPTYSEGALRNAIGSLIPGQSSISGALAGVISKLSPITGALTGLKSAVQSTLSAPARASLVSSAPPAVAVPAPQVYYLY